MNFPPLAVKGEEKEAGDKTECVYVSDVIRVTGSIMGEGEPKLERASRP